jgi:putative FmdB family regulatory protein
MPTYSYNCTKCNHDFELFFYIKDYNSTPNCDSCGSDQTTRRYIADVATQSASVRKCDTELKTVGDLANRNRDRMSEDQLAALNMKHNEYKYDTKELKDLPSGMSRVNKKEKIKWPGTQGKKRRKLNGK